MAEDKLFFVAQKAFIMKNGKLLVIFDLKERIDVPGGKIQEGEGDFAEALLREVREETTLDVEIGEPFTTWTFVMPPDHPRYAGKSVFLVGYECFYKGGEVSLSEDHLKFAWVDKDELGKFNDGSEHFKAMERYLDREMGNIE